jgi:hypothetical protein
VKGVVNGCDHPTWEDGTPILVGQLVRFHDPYEERSDWPAVIHEVAADEVRIGGMTSDEEEWEDQCSPDDLSRDDAPKSARSPE